MHRIGLYVSQGWGWGCGVGCRVWVWVWGFKFFKREFILIILNYT